MRNAKKLATNGEVFEWWAQVSRGNKTWVRKLTACSIYLQLFAQIRQMPRTYNVNHS